jgi:hypothetical protein
MKYPLGSGVTWLRAGLGALGVGLLSFGLAALGTAADAWPLPRAFDEFSYVLAGETFARGRLANPPYAVPDAVATIHVVQQPAYASKYLPGHGLVLALGIALGGGPRLGQWLAFGGMGAALFWMLTGWLSRRAALVTTGVFVLVLADTDWASGFWGSSLAVAGSALVFGVVPRLAQGPHVRFGVLAGLGAALLALTRPFEGLAVSLVPAAYIAWWLLAARDRKRRIVRVALPCTAVLSLSALLLGAHNRAVTGSPFRLAYAHYEEGAVGAPAFIWQPVNSPRGPLRANEQARLGIDLGSYTDMRRNWPLAMWSRSTTTLRYYFPHAVFALAFFLVPLALRDRRLWLAVAAATAVGAAIGASSFYLPHYVGPALPPLLLLYAAACGVVARVQWSGHRLGRAAVAGLTSAIAAYAVFQIFSHDRLEHGMTRPGYWTRQRDAIARTIAQIPGQHLVFVRYAADYRSQNEWVQNRADLAGARLLWVHDRGDSANASLRAMETSRSAWLVSVRGTDPAQVQSLDSAIRCSRTALRVD